MVTVVAASCENRDEWGRHSHGPRDRAIAALAARQHGVVALWQLAELGLGGSGARKRLAAGRLHRVHRGVYAVGHPLLTRSGRSLAAVLACGRGAVVSHRPAASLWGLRPSARAIVDVTIHGRAGRARPGIEIHHSATLVARDATSVDGIPATSVARTLLDLAAVVARRALERACDQAEVLRLLDMHAIDDVLARAGGHRGAGALRGVLGTHAAGTTLTRSELGERLLAICRDAGLPTPEVNAWLPLPDGGGAEADFLWRDRRLVVEVDGRTFHTARRAFEADRRRDQRLLLAGWRVVRFTCRQVTEDGAGVAATIAALRARQ